MNTAREPYEVCRRSIISHRLPTIHATEDVAFDIMFIMDQPLTFRHRGFHRQHAGRAFDAASVDDLLESVSSETGLSPEATAATPDDHVYEVGDSAVLFTAPGRDVDQQEVARGILLERWGEADVGDRQNLVPHRFYHRDHQHLLFRTALAYLVDLPLALHGHTGVGKTELIYYFASLLGAPVYRMNLHGLSTTDDVIGKLLPAGQGRVEFQDGLVTTAVRNGGLLLLEEMNATGQELWFSLHGLLDGSRRLVLVEKDNEVVHQHPHCRIFSTFNPSEYPTLYPGTKDLSAAYLRRWMSVRVDFASREDERAILLRRFPEYESGALSDVLDKMLDVAVLARRILSDGGRNFDFVMSTGVLVEWADLALHIGPIDAARMSFYDILEERTKTVMRDQVFSYATDWEIDKLDEPPRWSA